MSATRSGPMKRHWRRKTTPCRCMQRSLRRRSIGPLPPAPRCRSRRAARARCSILVAASRSPRRVLQWRTRHSTLHPGAFLAGSSPSAASAPRRRRDLPRCFRSWRVTERALGAEVVATAREMNACGLNRGTSGNVSARFGDGFLITPSGLAYAAMGPQDIVAMTLDGEARGALTPSSEWRFHRALYVARPELGAVVHAHSPFATTLACLGRDIPAFHYMVAVAGGNNIRCAAYATFGTQLLAEHALAALQGRDACLLANHGMI